MENYSYKCNQQFPKLLQNSDYKNQNQLTLLSSHLKEEWKHAHQHQNPNAQLKTKNYKTLDTISLSKLHVYVKMLLTFNFKVKSIHEFSYFFLQFAADCRQMRENSCMQM